MGCCTSSGDPEQRKRNAEINKMMKQDRAENDKKIKLLLLGAGESGKSTLLKQMQLIYKSGFSHEEKMSYRMNMFRNAIANMQSILTFIEEQKIPMVPENEGLAEEIQDIALEDITNNFPQDTADAITTLWKDSGVLSAFARRSEFQLEDSASYLFENVQRFTASDYVPSEEDILRCRVKTTGIVETRFEIQKFPFEVYDVGGQKNERRKWINLFEDVTAVIFTVALSEYDQVMREDTTKNRMIDSLELFEQVCNDHLPKPSIFLFLNKKDLFEEKIKHVDLKTCFADYNGGNDAETAMKFIQQKFTSVVRKDGRQVIPHITCATDNTMMRDIFSGVQQTILFKSLQNAGM
eukprot:GFYU01001531.1.p1 GENE.GFYU01001531.1~~GFYU01001531.1.p1  ORF type:complete len:351 (-),score=124.97 GFYU01001531.1:372-1424(-)